MIQLVNMLKSLNATGLLARCTHAAAVLRLDCSQGVIERIDP